MSIENRMDFLLIVLGAALLLVLIAAIAVRYIVSVYLPFMEERDFIRMEIMRSHGKERRRWERSLRLLYVSQIPLVGGLLASCLYKKRKK